MKIFTKIKQEARVILAKLSLDQALMRANSHAKKDEVAESQKLYQSVLQAFSKNKTAQQGLAALNKPKQNIASQSPPQEAVDQLVNLYNQGHLQLWLSNIQRHLSFGIYWGDRQLK